MRMLGPHWCRAGGQMSRRTGDKVRVAAEWSARLVMPDRMAGLIPAWSAPDSPPVPPSTAPDPGAVASQVEAVRPGWVVLWSPWRRTFTAFGCFAPVPVVLDDPVPVRLVSRMDRLQARYAGPSFSSWH